MTGFVVVLVPIIAGGVSYLAWVSSAVGNTSRLPEPPPTEAEILQARLDLLEVQSGVDVALATQEQHQASARIKEAIAAAMEDGQS
jgi:hypothetical protein